MSGRSFQDPLHQSESEVRSIMGVQAAQKVAAIGLFVQEPGPPGQVVIGWTIPEAVLDGLPETDNERYMLLVVTRGKIEGARGVVRSEIEVARGVVPVGVGKASFELKAGIYTIFATIVWAIGAGESPAAELLRPCGWRKGYYHSLVCPHKRGLWKLNQRIHQIEGPRRKLQLSPKEQAELASLLREHFNLLRDQETLCFLDALAQGKVGRSPEEARLDFTVTL